MTMTDANINNVLLFKVLFNKKYVSNCITKNAKCLTKAVTSVLSKVQNRTKALCHQYQTICAVKFHSCAPTVSSVVEYQERCD